MLKILNGIKKKLLRELKEDNENKNKLLEHLSPSAQLINFSQQHKGTKYGTF